MNKKDRVTLSVFVCVCCCIHVFLGYDSIQSITSMFVKALNGTSHRPNLSHFYFSFQSSNVSNCVCAYMWQMQTLPRSFFLLLVRLFVFVVRFGNTNSFPPHTHINTNQYITNQILKLYNLIMRYSWIPFGSIVSLP